MKSLIISLLLLFFSASLYAQEGTDSVSEKLYKYETRLQAYQNIWNALIPDFTRMQYAGSVGLISAGIGWDYGKHNQWETDLMLGYLPKYSTSDNKLTMTVRQSYIPWTCNMGKKWDIQPLSCGLFFNTVFNDKFWVREPSRYPGGYYGFSSKIRSHVFIGQRYIYEIEERHRFFARNVSFCWELSTCDLYLASAITNHDLKLIDILSLSFGLKFTFF